MMQKRSRFIPARGSGGGGGVAGAATFIINETRNLLDALSLAFTLPDERRESDEMALTMTFPETIDRTDSVLLPSIQFEMPDTKNETDLSQFGVNLKAISRSGSPDADDWGDAWTDATVGQTGVNHGNETPLSITNALASTERRGFMEYNLARFTGLTAVGGLHNFLATYANAAPLTAVTVTLHFGAQASRWFTESTITNSNQPATPTLFTKTVSVPAGGAAFQRAVAFTDAEMNQLIGKWVLIVFTVPLLTADAASVRSRESADTGINRATTAFVVQI